jgi:hypothetical protein
MQAVACMALMLDWSMALLREMIRYRVSSGEQDTDDQAFVR